MCASFKKSLVDFEYVILVKNKTRLENLTARFNTITQSQFYIERAGQDFNEYNIEHDNFYRSLEKIERRLSSIIKFKIVDREFLPSFIFSEKFLVVVVGQDGLVANTAKYTGNIPIIGVNPDPSRYDGVLLPFDADSFQGAVEDTLNFKSNIKQVTMASAELNDGQKLLAFNDFFIGAASHISSRYAISYKGQQETQSSSGVIVSTGAGSTGWLSSVFNMNQPINSLIGNKVKIQQKKLNWESNELVYVVREPFLSKSSQINLSSGLINKNNALEIESHMPDYGVIFSDGIEKDFIAFNSGAKVIIKPAAQKANLVVNKISKIAGKK